MNREELRVLGVGWEEVGDVGGVELCLIGRISGHCMAEHLPAFVDDWGPCGRLGASDNGYLSVLLTRLLVEAPLLTLCDCLKMQDLPHANCSYNPLMYSFW